MGHNLNFANGKVAFASAEPAWHNLGKVLKRKMTIQEAIEFGGLDYEVEKYPLFAKVTHPDGSYDFVPADNSYGTVRTDTNQVLGTVGDKYQVLQNRQAFTFFDALMDEEDAFIESVGALGNGERIFICAKLPEHISILGDDELINQYLMMTTTHDGSGMTLGMFTPVRVVCQNTLNAALHGKKSNMVNIKHTGGQYEAIKMAHQVMGLSNQYRQELAEIFYKMADTKLTDEWAEKILVAGTADTPSNITNYFDADAKQSTRFRRNVQKMMDYMETNATQQTTATKGTVYGAYNAVTGYYQNEHEWKSEAKKMESIIDFNGRTNEKQQRAFEVCKLAMLA